LCRYSKKCKRRPSRTRAAPPTGSQHRGSDRTATGKATVTGDGDGTAINGRSTAATVVGAATSVGRAREGVQDGGGVAVRERVLVARAGGAGLGVALGPVMAGTPVTVLVVTGTGISVVVGGGVSLAAGMPPVVTDREGVSVARGAVVGVAAA